MRLLHPAILIGFLLTSPTICNAASTAGTSNGVNTSSLQFRPLTINEPVTGTRFVIYDYFKYSDPNRRWMPKISYDPRTERRLDNHESFEECLEHWRDLLAEAGGPVELDGAGIYTSSYGFWLHISVRRPYPKRYDEVAALSAVSQNLNYFLDRARDPDWGYRPLKIRMLSSSGMLLPMRLLAEVEIWYQPDWQPVSLQGPSINQTTATNEPIDDAVQVTKLRRRRDSNTAVTHSSGGLPASVGIPKHLNATSLNRTSLGFTPITIDDHRTGTHLVITDRLDMNHPIWLPKVSRSPRPRPGAVNEESLVDCLKQWRDRISEEGPPEELDVDAFSLESYGFILDIAPVAPYARFLDEGTALRLVSAHLHEFLETDLPGPMSWYRPLQVEISRTHDPEQLLAVMEITFDPSWQPPDDSLELPSANRTTSTSVHDGADLARS